MQDASASGWGGLSGGMRGGDRPWRMGAVCSRVCMGRTGGRGGGRGLDHPLGTEGNTALDDLDRPAAAVAHPCTHTRTRIAPLINLPLFQRIVDDRLVLFHRHSTRRVHDDPARLRFCHTTQHATHTTVRPYTIEPRRAVFLGDRRVTTELS